jgi:hypothetical protein
MTEARIKWGEVLDDVEHRLEHVRQLKPTDLTSKEMIQAVGVVAAVFAAGAVVGGLIVWLA